MAEKAQVLDDTGDVNLFSAFVPDIPKDVIFPTELNTFLKRQLLTLTNENLMLKQNLTENESKLKESETQLEELNKKLKSFETVNCKGFSSVTNIASSQIVKLSKMLREKVAELEATKTKCSKLEQRVILLQQGCDVENNIESGQKKEKSDDKLKEQVKQLQENLNSVSAKLFECRKTNVCLKNDLKFCNSYLQQETGSDFEALKNSSPNGNWMGRAQVIENLRRTNAELKEKLKQSQEKGARLQEQQTQMKSDSRLIKITSENTALKIEVSDLRKKLEGCRAKSNLLESECSVFKTKLLAISEQQERDKQLVSSLTMQLANTKNVQIAECKLKDQTIQKVQKDVERLNLELMKERCNCEKLQDEVSRLTSELNDVGERVTEIPVDNAQINNKLEAERIRLVELIDVLHKRLDAERDSLTSVRTLLNTEKQRNVRLEVKIARLQLESDDNSSVYISHSNNKSTDSKLADRLELAEETIKTLMCRLEIEKKERQLDYQAFSDIIKNYNSNTKEE